MIDGALGAAGTNVATVGLDKLAQNGVLYKGLEALGGGAIITGLVFGGIVVMLIDRKPNGAGVFCLIGAVLAFFGFIHGPAVGMAVSPMIAFSYVVMAAICFGFTKMELAPEDA